MDRLRPRNPNIKRILLPVALTLAWALAACGGGGGGGTPTPRPTWEGCISLTPGPPVTAPAFEVTKAMQVLATNPVDASCVATAMPVIPVTETPTP